MNPPHVAKHEHNEAIQRQTIFTMVEPEKQGCTPYQPRTKPSTERDSDRFPSATSESTFQEFAFFIRLSHPLGVLAPGLFYYLLKDGVLTENALAPLLAVLPPEKYISTNLRGGEAYDSTRWPVANDAALASIAAQCLDKPALEQALQQIAGARGDRLSLRALARASTAQSLAAMGGDADLFLMLWPDATPADLALFSAPQISAEIAQMVEVLCHAHYQAADGLYAYHVHRRIPGPSAEPAARIVRYAIENGKMHPDELISLAMTIVQDPTRIAP